MSHRAGAMGRSWHDGMKDPKSEAILKGLNFDEQWQHALAVNPKFIFITGWNEWIAGRYTEWSKYTDRDCYYPGGLFVDQYTEEYSRDCEPMRGGHGDNYYYQLMSWVRRFKGVRPLRFAPARATKIRIDGAFEDWAGVTLEFRDTIGDTIHRNHQGYGDLIYRNDTGRNDLVCCKVAYDRARLYFFAQTREAITSHLDTDWMEILLDTDRNPSTGLLGYDFVVNQEVLSDHRTTVKAWRNDRWVKVGTAEYRVRGNALEVSLSRSVVNQIGANPSFDFHWADNIRNLGDVAEYGVDGDSAPNRRCNFRFQVLTPSKKHQ
jgi:hypothetical protein